MSIYSQGRTCSVVAVLTQLKTELQELRGVGQTGDIDESGRIRRPCEPWTKKKTTDENLMHFLRVESLRYLPPVSDDYQYCILPRDNTTLP